MIFVESGGDNLSATSSPELADLMIYVIDVEVIVEIYGSSVKFVGSVCQLLRASEEALFAPGTPASHAATARARGR